MEASIQLEHPAPWQSEARLLWRQSLPNIGMTCGRMLLGFTDFVMVAKLGTEATAAISPSTFFLMVVVCIGMGIAGSVTTFSAQAFGRGDRREAAAYAWQSLYIAAAFSLLCPVIMALIGPFFHLFDHAPAVRDMEIEYCRVAIWCMGPSIAVAGLNGFFIGVQRPSVGFHSIIVALVWNVIGNYAFIFGKFGCPKMGIAGAAVATVGAWVVRAIIMMAIFLHSSYAAEFDTRTTWRPDWRRLTKLFAFGWPTAMQWLLDIGAWFLFLAMIIGPLGTTALAGANICWQYMTIAFMPAIGIGLALCSLVGHAVGEGRPELALRRAKIALAMVSTFMGVVGLTYIAARTPLVRLFNRDPDVVAAGAAMMIWVGLFQVFDGFFHVYHNALRGAGDSRGPAVAVAVTSWGIFFAGGWVILRLAPGLGFHGPWMMCTLYVIVLGVWLCARFHAAGWKNIRLLDGPTPTVEAG